MPGSDAWPLRPCTSSVNGADIFSAGAHEVEDAATELEPVAGSLVDARSRNARRRDASSHSQRSPAAALAHLLVRRRGEDQVAGRPRSPPARARRRRQRSPRPGPSCRARPGPRLQPSLTSPDHGSHRPLATDRRARRPCARAGAATARLLAPESARRGSRAPGCARRARTRRRSPRGTRAAARRRASRSPAGSTVSRRISSRSSATTSSRTAAGIARSILSPMGDLFSDAAAERAAVTAPLARALRPRTLDEFVGQQHVLGPGLGAAARDRGGPCRAR